MNFQCPSTIDISLILLYSLLFFCTRYFIVMISLLKNCNNIEKLDILINFST